LVKNKGKLRFILENCEILTLFDICTTKSNQFIVIEKNDLIWKLITFDKRKEVYLPESELNRKGFIHSVIQRQILRLWYSTSFKPHQFLAKSFDQIIMPDSSRLIFFSKTISGGQQLIDNGEFWKFPEYSQPFIFCGHLTCPVKLNSGQWTIAVEKIQHYKFKANEMPINIQVDNKTQLLSFRHPDNLSGWVTISLADYGLKPVE